MTLGVNSFTVSQTRIVKEDENKNKLAELLPGLNVYNGVKGNSRWLGVTDQEAMRHIS